MSFQEIVFYFFSAIMVFSALRMITVRNPVHAALFLVLTFFTAAALWLLMEAEFLGVVLVLVYVGAVMVLFLFVVMMLDINISRMREGFIRFLPVGVLVAALMVAEMVAVVGAKYFDVAAPAPGAADYSNTQALGGVLYTDYVYPFEIAAVILLVAIIAAIALTLRRRPETKYQNPGEQVRISRKDRVRLVRMKSEKKS
ncbi:MAG: NADH-quinone oxidoreductase subunit J [Gammaproteobacteria bacterium]|jgi:NADH-quinone oxidoreductase subunit J